jgi:DNA-binding NtrC family response regulator
MFSRIAFIDNDPDLLESITWTFFKEPYEVYLFHEPYKALKKLKSDEFALVIIDQMILIFFGTDIIYEIKKINPKTEIIIMASNPYTVREQNIEYEVIIKPWDIYELKEIVRRKVELYNKGIKWN